MVRERGSGEYRRTGTHLCFSKGAAGTAAVPGVEEGGVSVTNGTMVELGAMLGFRSMSMPDTWTKSARKPGRQGLFTDMAHKDS